MRETQHVSCQRHCSGFNAPSAAAPVALASDVMVGINRVFCVRAGSCSVATRTKDATEPNGYLIVRGA